MLKLQLLHTSNEKSLFKYLNSFCLYMNIKYSGIRWIHVLLNFTLYRITNKSFHLNIHNSKKACKHDITFVIFFTYLFTSTLYRVQLLDTSFCSFVCHVFTIDCQDCFVPEFRFHVSSNNSGETYVAVLRSTTQNYCCQILCKSTCTQNYAINKLVEIGLRKNWKHIYRLSTKIRHDSHSGKWIYLIQVDS